MQKKEEDKNEKKKEKKATSLPEMRCPKFFQYEKYNVNLIYDIKTTKNYLDPLTVCIGILKSYTSYRLYCS